MERLVVIKGNVNQAADQIALLSPDRWCGWICYLLQLLDDCTTEEGRYCAFLEDIDRHITTRLERGKW
jgi:hypothetical protein